MSSAQRDTGPPSASGTFSRFGGLWIDRHDWPRILKQKLADGMLTPQMAKHIARFARDGVIVFKRAVPTSLTAALRAELDEFWRNPPDDARIETFDNGHLEMIKPELRYRAGVTKLFHYHAFSATARKAIAAPVVVEFLTAIFEAQPKAFQSLTFWNGSQQSIHKDTAYVQVDGAPMELAATWLALEDVQEGSGALEYYIGSHRAPDFLFGGEHKWMDHAPHDHDAFLQSHHDDAEKYGYKKATFLAREGDVLIWHADLAHGGGPITRPGVTRQSLVTHLTSAKRNPPYQKHARRVPWGEGGMLFIADIRQI